MRPILALLVLLAAAPFDALACSCAPPRPVAEAVEGHDRVFLGTVTSIESPDGFLQRVTFQVSEHFKGSQVPVLEVETNAHGPTCGYPFQEGVQYVVYAHGEEDALEATSCSRTSVAVQPGSDLEILRAGR